MRRAPFLPLMLYGFAVTACLLAPGIDRAAEPVHVVRPAAA